MAKLIEAILTLGPRLVYGRAATTDDLAQSVADRIGLSPKAVRLVLGELGAAIGAYAVSGVPVQIEGVGRFRPALNRDGTLRVHVLPDPTLADAVADLDAYQGEVVNRANAGLDDAGYKEVWDAAYPDDPLEVGGT